MKKSRYFVNTGKISNESNNNIIIISTIDENTFNNGHNGVTDEKDNIKIQDEEKYKNEIQNEDKKNPSNFIDQENTIKSKNIDDSVSTSDEYKLLNDIHSVVIVPNEEIIDEVDEYEKISNEFEFCEQEKYEDESLLKTISFLVHKTPPFNSFKEILYNDFIARFVMIFFNISSIENVNLNKENDKLYRSNIDNIFSVINFLKKKERKFQVLVFNFDTALDRIASSKLFFSTFLNIFFVTKPHDEMIEKLLIIGSNSYTKFSSSKHSLYRSSISLARILSKLEKGNINDLSDTYIQNLEDLNLPNIYTPSQWNVIEKDKIYPDSFFYQLQFFFDQFDLNYHVVEIFFFSKNKIKTIKVPRFDVLLSSIRAKHTYPINNIDQYHNFDYTYKAKNREEFKSSIFLFENYKKKIKRGNTLESKEKIPNSYEYWNGPDNNFLRVNGVFIQKLDQDEIKFDLKKSWRDVVKISIEKKLQKKLDLNNPKFLSKKQENEVKLYKIFYYDDNLNEWKFDSDSFEEFKVTNKIDINSIMPLIFFSNSSEEDILKIMSQITNRNFLRFDDENDQIFVHAILEKELTLNNLSNNEKKNIMPLYLMLHIPKIKQSLPNLSTIVFQINLYFHFISTLIICVLNEKTFQEQINYMKILSSIVNEKYDYDRIPIFLEDNDAFLKKCNKLFKLSINLDLRNIFILKNMENEYNTELFKVINTNNDFLQLLSSFKIKPVYHIIDIDNIETYDMFIKEMTFYLLKANQCCVNEMNFDIISLKEISSLYIKSQFSKNDIFEEILEKRFLQLMLNEKNAEEAFRHLLEEIKMNIPECVIEFWKIYKQDLIPIRKKLFQLLYREFIISELKQNAELNIDRIKNLIKDKSFISKNQMEKIIRSHQKFLHNIFFEIIKSKFNDSVITSIYEYNKEYMDNQIKEDRKKINLLFGEMLKKIQKRNEIAEIDASDKVKKQTNYVLKEVENIREIKVSVNVNEGLTSVIEQDF
ncbi:hypothetical protein M9Y10_024451 [Tritrichomonas musculus]|uniref:Uncharacterized protein n=1 Tax=Tritrichomonas musculus TaxID=1915356 RepID=A0ABR2HC10_9EUKA